MDDSKTPTRAEAVPGRDRLWVELAAQEPAEVRLRSGADWSEGAYALEAFGTVFRVDPGRRTVDALGSDSPAGGKAHPLAGDPEFELTLLCYLTQARDLQPAGRWVSERDLPGGNLFFRGPHALPAAPVLQRFGGDAEGFRERCRQLGGRGLEFGDASFAFRALPRVPLACVLYVRDEEFPARVGFLVDSTIAHHLPLDVILALVHSLVRLLAA